MWTVIYFNMGRPTKGFCLFLLFVGITTSLKAVSGQTYNQLGGTLVLTPLSPPESGSSITWKLDSNKVIEYDPDFSDEAQPYGRFVKRTTLNKITGELKMNDLTKEDGGVYTLEVRSELQETYTVAVIRAISATPTISLSPKSCDIHHRQCQLTCELPVTTDAEPLTYSWKAGDEPWKDSSDKHWDINHTAAEKTFICKIKNPVSEKDSEHFIIPKHSSITLKVVLGVLFSLPLIILIVLGVLSQFLPDWKKKRDTFFNRFRRGKTVPDTENTVSLPLSANAESPVTKGDWKKRSERLFNRLRGGKTDAENPAPNPEGVSLMNLNNTKGVPDTENTASSPPSANAESPVTKGVPDTENTASSPPSANAASPVSKRVPDTENTASSPPSANAASPVSKRVPDTENTASSPPSANAASPVSKRGENTNGDGIK